MAEGDGGWWGGWLQQSFQAVKYKSAEAYEFIKRDLTEFSNVVQHDTASSIAATAISVRDRLTVEGSSEATDKVKKSLSNILGVITDTLVPPPDKTIDCNVITLVATPAGTTEVYDSKKARLYSLQADPATYCNQPDGPPGQFEAWLSSFSLEEMKGEIAELLVNSPSIRALYTKMVPAAVSHSDFWQRYFYKVFQLDQEGARRVEKSTDSDGLDWEEEEDEFMVATLTSRLDSQSLEESRFMLVDTATAPPDLTEATGPVDPMPSSSSGACSPLIWSEEVWLQRFGADQELAQRLTEASVEEPGPARNRGLPETGRPTVTRESSFVEVELESTAKTERGEGSNDLRVYELNSDSGKSSPSLSGKEGWSTDVSEDWEKDFDLDVTEEEVKLAHSMNTDGELDDEDWDNWD